MVAELEASTPDEAFAVLPENWPTVQLFMSVQTQWQFASNGTPLGLDYNAVDVVMRRKGIADQDGRIFEGLQIMEWAAIDAVRD